MLTRFMPMVDKETPHTGNPFFYGITKKLGSVLFAIIVLVVVTAVISLFLNLSVKTSQTIVNQRALPALSAVQSLRINVQQLIGRGARITVGGVHSKELAKAHISPVLQKAQTSVKNIRDQGLYSDQSALDNVDNTLTTIAENLYELITIQNDIISTKNGIQEKIEKLTASINKIEHKTNVIFTHTHRDSKTLITNIGIDVENHLPTEDIFSSLELLSFEKLDVMKWVESIKDGLHTMRRAISNIENSQTVESLELPKKRLRSALKQLVMRKREAYNATQRQEALTEFLTAATKVIFDKNDGLFSTYSHYLSLLESRDRLLEQNKAFAADLEHNTSTLYQGLSIVIAQTVEDASDGINLSLWVTCIVAFLVVTISILLLEFYVRRILIKNIQRLNQKMADIAREEDSEPVDLHTYDEIGEMAKALEVLRIRSVQKRRLQEEKEETSHTIQENLRMAKEKAEHASLMKSEFLANMSHELRTPLNSILGFTCMLTEDSTMSHDNRQMSSTVHKSTTSLLEIVNDVLDISKIEAGSMIIEQVGFDIKNVVSSMVETMAPIASAKGVSIKYHYENNALPYIIGDPLRVGRILTNLVGNAVKYTKRGEVNIDVNCQPYTESTDKDGIEAFKYNEEGKVSVLVNSKLVTDDKIEIHMVVTDTGIGISEDKLECIFNKFTQADESTTRKFGGTGLGLAITKELVEAMDGEIGVESTVGVGSSFWVKLPFKVTEEINSNSHNKTLEPRQRENLNKTGHTVPYEKARILVAEDHTLNQELIRRILSRMEIAHIKIVESGVQAVEEWENDTYDLILMDCHMPEKNGYDATRDIREKEVKTNKHIPIIAITADAMEGTYDKCIECGMDEYLTKPIDVDELKNILGHWIILRNERVTTSNSNNIEADAAGQKCAENNSINLTVLEEFVDTPEEMKQFIDVFIEQSQISINNLKLYCIDGDSKEWVEEVHKFKSSTGVVGANVLQELCSEAQIMHSSTAKKRKEFLKKIKNEYANVKVVLQSLT